ncbi:MAG: thermonuclease family protein [Parvibaculum sp.]
MSPRHRPFFALLPCLVLASSLLVSPGRAAGRLEGPVDAEVLHVIDGDTLALRVHIWIGQTVDMNVRIAGIDAPELHGECASERARVEEARGFLQRLVEGQRLRLEDVRNDKYGGRVIAGVRDMKGEDIGEALLSRGLARSYEGRKRGNWCPA